MREGKVIARLQRAVVGICAKRRRREPRAAAAYCFLTAAGFRSCRLCVQPLLAWMMPVVRAASRTVANSPAFMRSRHPDGHPLVVKPIDFRWETRGIEKGSYSCMPWRRKGLVLHTPGSEKERRDWCRMFAPPTRGCQRGTSRHAGLCVGTPSEPCHQVPRFAPPYDRIPPSRLSRELLSKRVPTPS